MSDNFTAHIIPQERGMLSTIYLQLKKRFLQRMLLQFTKIL